MWHGDVGHWVLNETPGKHGNDRLKSKMGDFECPNNQTGKREGAANGNWEGPASDDSLFNSIHIDVGETSLAPPVLIECPEPNTVFTECSYCTARCEEGGLSTKYARAKGGQCHQLNQQLDVFTKMSVFVPLIMFCMKESALQKTNAKQFLNLKLKNLQLSNVRIQIVNLQSVLIVLRLAKKTALCHVFAQEKDERLT